mgnify:CR=1 FL=1
MSIPGTPAPLRPQATSLPGRDASKGTGYLLFCGQLSPEMAAELKEGGWKVHLAPTAAEALAFLRSVGLGVRRRPAYLVVTYGRQRFQAWEAMLEERLADAHMSQIPLILLGQGPLQDRRQLALTRRAIEVFDEDATGEELRQRLQYLEEEEAFLGALGEEEEAGQEYRIPVVKRAFDITVSLTLILLLSPLLLLVALLIKLESPGPILYISKRVGTGYQVFDFLKFRSMRVNADQELAKLKHLNQYGEEEQELVAALEEAGVDWQALVNEETSQSEWLVADDETISEEMLQVQREKELKASFVKVKDDPRVTRVGKFIRNTSVDELPQLFNVLRGDMSIVGNRPLPLYEAEKLTSDAWTLRFMAPAGITGWWQVKERGKSAVSEDSRKYLDVEYAQSYSLWLDIKILFMTIPALLQQENV